MSQSTLFDDRPMEPIDFLRPLVATYGYVAVSTALRSLEPTVVAASAPARHSDPETSHLASRREVDVGRFSEHSRQAKLLYAFSAADHGLTDQQAATRIVGATAAISALEGCRRRCSDLRAVHYLYDTGKRHKNTGSDEESIVWGISDAGRAALIHLDETGWSR